MSHNNQPLVPLTCILEAVATEVNVLLLLLNFREACKKRNAYKYRYCNVYLMMLESPALFTLRENRWQEIRLLFYQSRFRCTQKDNLVKFYFREEYLMF